MSTQAANDKDNNLSFESTFPRPPKTVAFWIPSLALGVLIRFMRLFVSQKLSFAPNWITRGSPAEVIEPNPADPTTVFGAPSGGVLVRLKTSARNSKLRASLNENRFIKAMSALRANTGSAAPSPALSGEREKQSELHFS